MTRDAEDKSALQRARRAAKTVRARTRESLASLRDAFSERARIPVNKRDSVRSWALSRSHRFRALRRRAKRKLGALEPLRIELYGGYVGPEQAYVWGRTVEDRIPSEPSADDHLLDDVRRALRQLRSDELMDVRVRVQVGRASETLVSDDEGFFLAMLRDPEREPGGSGVPTTQSERWLPVSTEVVAAPDGAYGYEPQAGKLLVPARTARFAIVTDIDDTVLQSHVRNRFKQAYVTLTRNALKRSGYEGTRELFQALREGGGQAPVFYLSRSAWNVHPLLTDFIRYQGLPEGPLILRDVGLFNTPEIRRGHKARELARLAQTFPDLPFVLIGDSGQADADIYADACETYPGRLRAILIRNVTSEAHGLELGERLAARCPGVHTLVFDHADEARRVCETWGLAQARLRPSAPISAGQRGTRPSPSVN